MALVVGEVPLISISAWRSGLIIVPLLVVIRHFAALYRAEAGRDTKLWFVCDYCSYLLLPNIPKTINIYQNCIIDFAEEFTILQPRTCCNQLKIGVHQTNLYWTFKAQQIWSCLLSQIITLNSTEILHISDRCCSGSSSSIIWNYRYTYEGHSWFPVCCWPNTLSRQI